MKVNVDDLTIGQARELGSLFGRGQITPGHSFEIGSAYLFRCVTHYYTGRIVAITETDIVLEDAAWIADTGRFSTCLTSGQPNEVEPYPGQVIISRGAIVDASRWVSALPRDQK